MVHTTRHAGWPIAALAALAGFNATSASATEPRPSQPVSIVAQSTKATAGTGRRPIGERIPASNLPPREPTAKPPLLDNSPVPSDPPVPDDAPVASEPPVPDDPPVAADPPVPHDAPFASEPPLPDAGGEEAVTTATPEVAETEPALAEAVVVTLPTAVAEDPALQQAVADPHVVVEAAPPAEAPPQSKPADAVGTSLLRRIKGAFTARPRASAVAVPPPGTAALSPAAPETPVAPQRTVHDTAATAPAPQAAAAPARLEFDVRESRALVGEGEQIVMRIAVRNVGGTTAERVTTTLFFADGIEPVQAIGHAAEVYPGEVRFATVPELPPGSSVDLLVTAVGTRPGSVAYRGELACGQLAGLMAREGAVTVQPRRAPMP